MFLLFKNTKILIFILSITTKSLVKDPHSKLVDKYSLTLPHVEANGREENFLITNEHLTKTRSRKDYTQMNYRAPNSFATIISKNPFTLKDFEISFDFTLNNITKSGKDAGFGFWISDHFIGEQRFYGRSPSFNGIGVVIDIENTPFIRFIDNSNLKRSGVPIKFVSEDLYRVVIEKRAGLVSAKFMHNGKEHILFSGKVHIPREAFIGITSFSGTGYSTMLVEKIITYSYPHSSSKVYVKGERSGRSLYIVILGGICIVSLAYYLYQKKPKEFSLKK